MTKDDIRVGMTFVYDAKQYRVVTPYDDGFMAQVVKSGESRIVMRYFHHNLLPRFEKA